MTAYSFKKRFVEPIRLGTKRQTIRATGKRHHARLGGMLQLYAAMRTVHCFKIIRDTPCVKRSSVAFHMPPLVTDWWVIVDGDEIADPVGLNAFAVTDGFTDFADLALFWIKEHKAEVAAGIFRGELVGW